MTDSNHDIDRCSDSPVTAVIRECLGELDENSQPGAVERAVSCIASKVRVLSPFQREQLQHEAKKRLRTLGLGSATMIEMVFKPQKVEMAADEMEIADPPAWPAPVDAAVVLDEISAFCEQHIVLPPGAADTIALWSAFSYSMEAFATAPNLGLVSATKRCGKTSALELICELVRKPFPTSNISVAAIYRSIELWQPTLIMDEVETFLGQKEELRGVLNAGHRRSMAFVVRCVGDDHKPTRFSVWCPKVFGLIGHLPSTLEDRSVIITMQRKLPGSVKKYNPMHHSAQVARWRSQLLRWTQDNLATLQSAEPKNVPGCLNDRAADNWHPLLAIADTAAGTWPERARSAATALYAAAGAQDADVSVQLLEDMKRLFDSGNCEWLESEFVVQNLAVMDERPWPEWKNGRPITPKQIADELKPFGIRPTKFRNSIGRSVRGYARCAFEDVFARYFPDGPPQPPHTEQRNTSDGEQEVDD